MFLAMTGVKFELRTFHPVQDTSSQEDGDLEVINSNSKKTCCWANISTKGLRLSQVLRAATALVLTMASPLVRTLAPVTLLVQPLLIIPPCLARSSFMVQ